MLQLNAYGEWRHDNKMILCMRILIWLQHIWLYQANEPPICDTKLCFILVGRESIIVFIDIFIVLIISKIIDTIHVIHINLFLSINN